MLAFRKDSSSPAEYKEIKACCFDNALAKLRKKHPYCTVIGWDRSDYPFRTVNVRDKIGITKDKC